MATQRSNEGSAVPINLAILGAGNMGQRLAKAFQSVPQVSIQYVYSRKLAQAETLANLLGAKPVTRQLHLRR
jgi:predicted dehydrogenase